MVLMPVYGMEFLVAIVIGLLAKPAETGLQCTGRMMNM